MKQAERQDKKEPFDSVKITKKIYKIYTMQCFYVTMYRHLFHTTVKNKAIDLACSTRHAYWYCLFFKTTANNYIQIYCIVQGKGCHA